MSIDPANPVVVLCALGMQAETERRIDEARALFQQAWDAQRSDYEASIAAHYLARHQVTLEDSLAWNQRALDHALAAPIQAVSSFLPSLYLNLGHSHEMLGQFDEAHRCLTLGESRLAELPESPYAAVVRDGLVRMRGRLELPRPA